MWMCARLFVSADRDCVIRFRAPDERAHMALRPTVYSVLQKPNTLTHTHILTFTQTLSLSLSAEFIQFTKQTARKKTKSLNLTGLKGWHTNSLYANTQNTLLLFEEWRQLRLKVLTLI